jgi:hypothetical protein
VLVPFGFNYRNDCATVAEALLPANPCAVKVDDAIASSISSTITAKACATPFPILTRGCPIPANKSSMAVQLGFGGMGITGLALGSWLSLLLLGF